MFEDLAESGFQQAEQTRLALVLRMVGKMSQRVIWLPPMIEHGGPSNAAFPCRSSRRSLGEPSWEPGSRVRGDGFRRDGSAKNALAGSPAAWELERYGVG